MEIRSFLPPPGGRPKEASFAPRWLAGSKAQPVNEGRAMYVGASRLSISHLERVHGAGVKVNLRATLDPAATRIRLAPPFWLAAQTLPTPPWSLHRWIRTCGIVAYVNSSPR